MQAHPECFPHPGGGQAQGALQAGHPQGPLPPFERWSMAGPRYVQFLADLLHVHVALEGAIAAAPSAAQLKRYGAPASWLACLAMRPLSEHHMLCLLSDFGAGTDR